MRLDRATSDQIASLPAITYNPDKISEKVEDGQGHTYVAVMFKHPPRVEVFLIVPGDEPPYAAEVDHAIMQMVIEEPEA